MSEADQALVTRYLSGNLTEEEQAMFEERVINDTIFQEEIELTHAMGEGLRELERRGEIAAMLAVKRSSWFGSTLAFAASIAAVAFAAISILLYARLDQTETKPHQAPQFGAPVAREILEFELTRSADGAPDAIWHRTTGPTLLELGFDVGLSPAASYETIIARENGADLVPLLVVPNASIGGDGRIRVSVHSGLLLPGDYQIQLAPKPASGSADAWVYSLRVLE